MIELDVLYMSAAIYYVVSLIIVMVILLIVGVGELDEFIGGMLVAVIEGLGSGIFMCLFYLNGYPEYTLLAMIHLIVVCLTYIFAVSDVLVCKHDEVTVAMFIVVVVGFVTEVLLSVGLNHVG